MRGLMKNGLTGRTVMRFNGVIKICLCVAACRYAGMAGADVRLPSIISDHMVLLKAEKVPVWGWADPGEAVAVALNGRELRAKADADGKWKVVFDLKDSGSGPFEMVVSGRNTITVRDVLVGEVWLGSGQSNAGLEMYKMIDYADEVATVTNRMHREFMTMPTPSLFAQQEDVLGFWRIVEPGSTKDFVAMGYFFMKELHRELNVPVGYINNCWGGVRLETYLSPEAIATLPKVAEELKVIKGNALSSSEAMRAWLEKTGRKDREPTSLEAFTQGPFTPENGWEKAEWINRKDLVSSGGKPENGVFWVAAEVDCRTEEWVSPKRLLICNNALFEKVYWNGELIGETSWHNYSGNGTRWHYYIPPGLVKDGVNYLAIRFYAPVEPPGFGWWPGLERKALKWHIKKEYGMAPLSEVEKPPVLKLRNVGPGSLFNGMLRPIIPYAIRGALWYQGEANAKSAYEYRASLPLLISDWRKHWGQERLPFYFVQLPQYRDKSKNPGDKSTWAELREAQLMTLPVPDTGMAVMIDTGESKDIHPLSKDIVGERLARIALANVYDQPIAYMGPLYESMKVEGNKIRISFKHLEGGLVAKEVPADYDVNRTQGKKAPLVRNSPDSELEGFAICGADQKWVWADAKIQPDNTVLVWSDKVPAPVAVRYAWADNPTGNLYNKAGLPASPFRTDDFQSSMQRK